MLSEILRRLMPKSLEKGKDKITILFKSAREKILMFVKEVMLTDVKTIGPKEPIQKAIRAMKKFRVGSLVVLRNGKPEGIVTNFDITSMENTKRKKIFVKNVMKTNLVFVSPEDSLNRAIELMTEHKIKRLPVIDNEKLVGIVSDREINEHFAGLLKKVENISSVRKYMGFGV